MAQKIVNMKEKKFKNECVTPNCVRKVFSRGLCTACISIAYYQVRRKKTSWQDLEKLGRALPLKEKISFNKTEWFCTNK